MEKCETCRFYLSTGEQGFCRRFPPAPLLAPGGVGQPTDIHAVFPAMTPEGWCGEYAAIRSEM